MTNDCKLRTANCKLQIEDRDTGRINAVRHHRAILVLSLVVVVVSLLLESTSDGHMEIPLLGITMPGTCLWRLGTGFECPGCGLTRCFIAMAHADWAGALHFHPAGTALFVIVIAQLPYRGIQLRRLARGQSELRHPVLAVTAGLLLAGFLVQWLLKTSGLVQF